jgi:hypothetical protein
MRKIISLSSGWDQVSEDDLQATAFRRLLEKLRLFSSGLACSFLPWSYSSRDVQAQLRLHLTLPSLTLSSLNFICFVPKNYFLCYSGRQHNKYFKTKQSTCLDLLSFITATRTCFGPYFGPSSVNSIKCVSHYWNILIWIHTSAIHYNHHNTRNYY